MSFFTVKLARPPIAFALGAVGMAALLGSGGCAGQRASDARAADPARNPLARTRHAAQGASTDKAMDTAAVERSAAYRQAVSDYAHRDFRGALGQVDSLGRMPRLSPEAQAFLRHQHELCEAALAGEQAPAASDTPARTKSSRPIRSASDGDTQPLTRADCGPRALALVCQAMATPANLDALRKAAGTNADGTSLAGLSNAAMSIHLKAEGVQMDRNALSNLSHPAIAWVDGNHYIAVLSVHHSLMDPGVNGDTATVHDPNNTREEEMPLGGPTGLLSRSGGMLLLLSHEDKLAATATH